MGMVGADIFAMGVLWLWLGAIEANRELNWVLPTNMPHVRELAVGLVDPLRCSSAEELLYLGSYDLRAQNENTQNRGALADELVDEFREYSYHVVSLQNCDREFMECLGARLKEKKLDYRPLHCFDSSQRGVRNPGLVMFFDISRVSLIDAKESFMANSLYFKGLQVEYARLQTEYARLHVFEKFFNFEGTEVSGQGSKSLPDDLVLLAYFALKGSQLRFKVANLCRSVLSDDDMYLDRAPAPQGLTVDPAEKIVFMMHPVNRYMHLSVRHALVQMQYFLGQSSCFDDHKFVMGNLGVLRKRFGKGPLVSTLLYGRVPYLQYAQVFGFENSPGAGVTSIYTGLYDSVFFQDRSKASVFSGLDVLDPLGHCNLILNSSEAKLQGILLHAHDYKNPANRLVARDHLTPRFNTKGFEGIEFWGACFRVSPVSACLAYSKHSRAPQREVIKGDIQDEMIRSGLKISEVPRLDGDYACPGAKKCTRDFGCAIM